MDVKFQMIDVKFYVGRHKISGVGRKVSGNRCKSLDVGRKSLGIGHKVSGDGCEVLDVGCKASSVVHKKLALQHFF